MSYLGLLLALGQTQPMPAAEPVSSPARVDAAAIACPSLAMSMLPWQAAKAGITGAVVNHFQVVIDPAGKLGQARLLNPSPSGSFNVEITRLLERCTAKSQHRGPSVVDLVIDPRTGS